METIEVWCPSCSKKGNLDVDKELVKNSTRGVTAINIKENTICKHSFVAYVDRNLVARDYFLVDFTISLPDIELKEELKSTHDDDLCNDIDIYLISINLHAHTLASIFKGIFLKQKMVLINEISIVDSHLLKFLEYCFKNTFAFELSILSKHDYKKDKKKYKNHLVISKDGILNDSMRLLTSKKRKVENAIIQKFLSIPDDVSSLIILKNEIFKAHEIALNAFNHVNGLSQNKNISFSIYELADYINEYSSKYNIKLHKAYLDFLIDIIMYYFELDISDEVKPEDFLGYL